jgi:hypothetical protein
MKEYTLYSVMIYGRGGLVGSIRVVATSKAQAVGIGNNWAFSHDTHPTRVVALENGRSSVWGIA